MARFSFLGSVLGQEYLLLPELELPISDHQQSWGYEDGPWKGPGPPLLVTTDF